MICNFGKRTGTDVLAGKIKNGFKIDVDDIRAICPDMIIQSNCPKPSKTKGRKSLRQLIANIIGSLGTISNQELKLLLN